ncbi:MAG: ABC transporter substrate-binding protein [Anaerobacillus sp.]|uniref:ABC transporter substrate-binding protein n=1 Tax=Anaerobacillus sp. TaxID=1872506 RepID=UPI0039198881
MKRNLFKTMNLMVIIFFAALVSVGCNSNSETGGKSEPSGEGTTDSSGEKVTLDWWDWGTLQGVEAMTTALFEAFPEYEDQLEISGVLQENEQAMASQLRLLLSANENVPDIIKFNRTQVIEFAHAGILEDLTSHVAPYLDNVVPGGHELMMYGEEVIAFPYEIKPKVWFYRTDMFEEANIDVNDIKNLDDFINAGKKLKQHFPDSYMFNMGGEIATYTLQMVLSGNGAKFVDDDGNYIVNKDPGVRKAFEAFKELTDSGVVVNIGDWTPDWEHGFADGTIASTLLSGWFVNFLPTYAPDQKGLWGATTWPEIGGAVGGSDAGGSVFVVPKNAPNKDLAIEILTKLTLTEEGRVGLFKHRSILPIIESVHNDPILQEPHPYFGTALMEANRKALENFSVFPFTPATSLEMPIVEEHLNAYRSGSVTLDEALDRAQRDLETQIGNPFDF